MLGVSQFTSKDLLQDHFDEHVMFIFTGCSPLMWLKCDRYIDPAGRVCGFKNRAIINYKSKAAQNTMLTTFNQNTCCFCTSAVQMLNAKVFWVFFLNIKPFSISCMIWGEYVLKESCYWSVETLHLCCSQWRVRSTVVVWQMLVVRSHLVCLFREKSRFPAAPCKLKPHQKALAVPCCSAFFPSPLPQSRKSLICDI